MSLPQVPMTVWNSPYTKPLFLWVVWLLMGTLVYAKANDLGWSKGFYMAVNVGYSIGWGYPVEKTYGVMWYSVVHLLIGASFVAAALGYFATNMIAVSKEWYVNALDEEAIGKETKAWHSRLKHWARLNINSLRIIGLWSVWIALMVVFSVVNIKEWVFIDGLYFAISSLSTGGLWAVPSDSPNWYFGIVGIFSATGVPLMAAAMSSLASMFIALEDPAEAHKIINAKVTEKELDMMVRFQIDDGDGEISRAEYILLCAVRLGAVNPELIRVINDRFNTLDYDKSGALSYNELLEHPEVYQETQRRKSVMGTAASSLPTALSQVDLENSIDHDVIYGKDDGSHPTYKNIATQPVEAAAKGVFSISQGETS